MQLKKNIVLKVINALLTSKQFISVYAFLNCALQVILLKLILYGKSNLQ